MSEKTRYEIVCYGYGSFSMEFDNYDEAYSEYLKRKELKDGERLLYYRVELITTTVYNQ